MKLRPRCELTLDVLCGAVEDAVQVKISPLEVSLFCYVKESSVSPVHICYIGRPFSHENERKCRKFSRLRRAKMKTNTGSLRSPVI